ncbi:hypothetical protein Cph01nite_11190 [Cellulomonas phragmiteti]|uniref:Uncharacterized protein n=1 Tax=Cellulomonas phragmiteti TaxID=478780 RepID=A0ABQ4DJ24_9CELL|nr:hypothetical protein Cph01nite_11190 [Cellulomonas phragmiteti]
MRWEDGAGSLVVSSATDDVRRASFAIVSEVHDPTRPGAQHSG